MTAKSVVVLVLAAIVGAAIYATAAPASQQAGPSRAEFNALKARVAKVEKNANTAATVLGACLQRGIPASRFNGYVALDSSNNPFQTSALDVDDTGTTPQAYLLDVGQACANAIARTYGRKLTAVHLPAVAKPRH